MKVYTKKGDKGNTSLIGGERVSKSSLRVEVYGTIDEFNCFVGHLFDLTEDKKIKDTLFVIQNLLFNSESQIASLPDYEYRDKLPMIKDTDIKFIEKEIDFMQNQLPVLTNFLLPSGCPSTSMSHICRTVCRRAERRAVELNENEPVNENILTLLNRLSDYFFVLARYFSFLQNKPDQLWKK